MQSRWQKAGQWLFGDGRCRESQEGGVAKGVKELLGWWKCLLPCGDGFRDTHTHTHIKLSTLNMYILVYICQSHLNKAIFETNDMTLGT